VNALVLATELPGTNGGLASTAAVAVALAERATRRAEESSNAVLFVEVGAERDRGPTLLASASARDAETLLAAAGLAVAARGRLAWVCIREAERWEEPLRLTLEAAGPVRGTVVHLPARLWRHGVEGGELAPAAALLRAELPAQRSLAALAVSELRAVGIAAKIIACPPGRVGTRRALAGIDPGGQLSRRARRIAADLDPAPRARGRNAERGARAASDQLEGRSRASLRGPEGQALPLVLGSAFMLVFASLLLAAFGGAVTGKSRAQRLADLAALSAARSMRDDLDRLFSPAELPDGSPNPRHLSREEYLFRAEAAAAQAVKRNGADPDRLELSFPEAGSFAPLRTRAELDAELELPAPVPHLPVEAEAEAEAALPQGVSSASESAQPMATGGGYSGPLAYRQGEPMRPDTAAAFDRMEAAARDGGVSLLINSAFRSDAEQAQLWEQNPDPRWVAPPGTSLHRCATELDLGPASAYGWLAAHAPRFGFLKRYSWEPWHFGFTEGPAPCSAAGDGIGSESSDGSASEEGLPSFVPAHYREPIAASARRWNVSPSLLAAQLMAESNFNPFALSPAGARGIAQFMPATAEAYGLEDPFDPGAAIDAQGHLMSDLLRQFDGALALALAAYNAGPAPVAACSCVPPYSETQAYVARILGLMGGAGALVPPTLQVRLVS